MEAQSHPALRQQLKGGDYLTSAQLSSEMISKLFYPQISLNLMAARFSHINAAWHFIVFDCNKGKTSRCRTRICCLVQTKEL